MDIVIDFASKITANTHSIISSLFNKFNCEFNFERIVITRCIIKFINISLGKLSFQTHRIILIISIAYFAY